ncbi:DUF2087 domain-containing protein [Proteinivorax hydrogeniformans]|uniref:DUF2087 domain-containing protein n=1 Tax=Proteinivorax hydrogeniformans TaxID=1826727 RepID=A0AAU8HUE0_9FIRM
MNEIFETTQAQKTIKNYFEENEKLKLKQMPAKQKRKAVILKRIAEEFNPNSKYTEKEVNDLIENIYPDYVTIRRYLIEFGFMERTKDGSKYWIKR